MPVGVQVAEFFYCAALEELGVSAIKPIYEFFQRLAKLSCRIGWGVVCRREEVIYEHYIVLFRVDERQVNGNRVCRPATFYVVVSNNQEISEPINTFVGVRDMKI